MAGLFSVSANPEVSSLVEKCGYGAAALTIMPIPGSELLGVMPLHVGMVIGIGHHYGRTLTRESATELVIQIGATVGLSLVGSRLATTAAKFILPGLGGIIAAPFMFASTLSIGAVADAWFSRNGELTAEQMRSVYNDAMSGAKSAFRPERMRSADAMGMASAAAREGEQKQAPPPPDPADEPVRRLAKAKEMLEQGLIDQDEFDAVKARILGGL